MPETNCTSCQQLLRFKDGLSGKTIRCPKCKARLTLPGSVPVPTPAPAVVSHVAADTSTEAVFETQEVAPLSAPAPAPLDDPFADADDEEVVVPRKKAEKKKKKKKKGNMAMLIGVLLLLVGLGGGAFAYWWFFMQPQFTPLNSPGPNISYNYDDPGAFHESVEANRTDGESVLDLEFINAEGNKVSLEEYKDKKHVVLVFMRGLTKKPGGICPSCSVQSSRLINRHKDFADRDAEILVVYPGSKDTVDEFVLDMKTKSKKAEIPFSVLLDVDLAAVKHLGIEQDQAKPSTFIISKDGNLVFGYVGETSVDRPSLNFMLQQLDALQPKTSDAQ